MTQALQTQDLESALAVLNELVPECNLIRFIRLMADNLNDQLLSMPQFAYCLPLLKVPTSFHISFQIFFFSMQ